MPAYGCCDLGSVNLTKFVMNPFTDEARFDFDSFKAIVKVSVRMLDNVLDASFWPLEQQRQEAMNKRRIGLGFLGLGDALVMLKTKYNSDEAASFAAKVTETMRDEAYRASVDLAIEKGAFPLFDAEKYLEEPGFASRLPNDIKKAIRKHGIRNSHLLSIAPTGTISLAFADNASNGIEPAFAWAYQRNRRLANGEKEKVMVEDYAYRAYCFLNGHVEVEDLPDYFVSAQDISALDHLNIVAAVRPFCDSAISKTINVPEDYPYDDFKDIYMTAYQLGLKGITTYRPNMTTGAVLELTSKDSKKAEMPNDIDASLVDPRTKLDSVPTPVLSSLRWEGRPKLPAGTQGWVSEMIEHPLGDFCVFVSDYKDADTAKPHPFEVWVNGGEQPRGIGAIAKTLSMDMRVKDKAWLSSKLEALEGVSGDDGFDLINPPNGELIYVKSLVAGFAKLVSYRCNQLDALSVQDGEATPMMDALMMQNDPKSGVNGSMSWTVDVINPATNDDFVMGVKELVMPNGQRRPYAMWLSGTYPKALDGLCKLLSLDMRVVDTAWIGMKLRKLLNYAEARGDFMAKEPSSNKSQNYPSTVAYVARLLIHRYAMLGLLTEAGEPIDSVGMFNVVEAEVQSSVKYKQGKQCSHCHASAVIKKDGCDFCTNCGEVGSCG